MNTPSNQSTFGQIFTSPVVWGLIINIVLTIIKIADPAFLTTDAYGTIVGLISAICAVLHIPVALTANASLSKLPPQ